MSSQGRQLEIDARIWYDSVALVCLLYDLRKRELLESRLFNRSSPYQYNRYQKAKVLRRSGLFCDSTS